MFLLYVVAKALLLKKTAVCYIQLGLDAFVVCVNETTKLVQPPLAIGPTTDLLWL